MKKILLIFLFISIFFSCDKEAQSVVKISAKTSTLDSLIAQDSTIINTFLPYKKKMTEEVNKVLSYAPKNLVRTDGSLQSSLGNLIADLSYKKANQLFEKETGKKVDFAFSNYGGIRAGIWKGDVKVLHAFNLMPFENTLVVAELTKEKTEELFEYFTVKKRAHPLSKQVQVIIDGDKIEIKINGKPLEDGRTYFVATSNYLQKGGDDMNFFAEPVSLFETNFLVRDAITEHFKSQDTLVSTLDNRVIIR